MDITTFFKENPRVGIALSGGVDSSFLLYQAVKYAEQVQPYFVQSVFQPAFERKDAEALCQKCNLTLRILSLDVLSREDIASNPINRCYYCKKMIFQAIRQAAQQDGISLLLDGTNASDDSKDRPGMRALEELQVLSPLAKCGYTKERIRAEARQMGLAVADKPSYACLATRIATNEPITENDLHRIEQGEKVLFSHGLSDFRIRIFHGAARVQLRETDLKGFLEQREVLKKGLAPWFTDVLLDMQCRTSD